MARPKNDKHIWTKGKSGNPKGRPPGSQNEVTKDFRQAVKQLLDDCGDELHGWIKRVAKKNPARAVECLTALAEYATPKLARITHQGDPDAPILYKQVSDDIPDEPEADPTTRAD